jgi:Protein of unknown function (DUF2798).
VCSVEPRDWRLAARWTPLVFAFWMAAIMALLMCTVITAANTGIDAGLPAACCGPMRWRCRWPLAACCW